MTKKYHKLPSVKLPYNITPKTLPFNGSFVTDKNFSFSFACFDRTHELFNLGGDGSDGVIKGKWFIELLDALKSVCNKTISEIRQSKTHDLHPIDWSKSKGRVIGFIVDGVFYIVWLDPYHNLTNSEGYGSVKKYKAPNC